MHNILGSGTCHVSFFLLHLFAPSTSLRLSQIITDTKMGLCREHTFASEMMRKFKRLPLAGLTDRYRIMFNNPLWKSREQRNPQSLTYPRSSMTPGLCIHHLKTHEIPIDCPDRLQRRYSVDSMPTKENPLGTNMHFDPRNTWLHKFCMSLACESE